MQYKIIQSGNTYTDNFSMEKTMSANSE